MSLRAKLREHYRRLGLPMGASLAEVKTAYRRLARQHHPDANRGSTSHDQFIRITESYRMLVEHGHQITGQTERRTPREPVESDTPPKVRVRVQSRPTKARHRKRPDEDTVTGVDPSRPRDRNRVSPKIELNPELSTFDQELKEKTYKRLKMLLASRRFPTAIAMTEALANRIPQDPEAKQWLAISYHRWGRELIDRRDFDKARIFLKKALRTDPHNRELWTAIDREFNRMERGGR